MSSYVLGERHISYLVTAATLWAHQDGLRWGERRLAEVFPEEIGAALLAENIASVRWNYPGGDPDDLPGPIPLPTPAGYVFRREVSAVDPVQVLKALDCYEYQSDNHPGWPTSAAARFCAALRASATRRLPGYEQAQWEVRAAPPLFPAHDSVAHQAPYRTAGPLVVRRARR